VIDLQAKRSSDISTELKSQSGSTNSSRWKPRKTCSTDRVLAYELCGPGGAQSLQLVFKILRTLTSELMVSQDAVIKPGDTIMVEEPRRETQLRGETSVPLPEIAPILAPTASVNVSPERFR
jgi:hypothetical protein